MKESPKIHFFPDAGCDAGSAGKEQSQSESASSIATSAHTNSCSMFTVNGRPESIVGLRTKGGVMLHRVHHRRRFLRQALAGAAGLVPMLAARQSQAATNQADVLIIGAGMSGVAAGWALQSTGIRPIVLEGRPDRIGGRIWTSYQWPDAPVDLGASWLTHKTINPLARIASQAGISTVPSDLLNLTLSEPDGRVLPQSEVDEIFSIYSATYAGVKAISQERIARRLPDIPASDAFETVLKYEKLSPQTSTETELLH